MGLSRVLRMRRGHEATVKNGLDGDKSETRRIAFRVMKDGSYHRGRRRVSGVEYLTDGCNTVDTTTAMTTSICT